MGEANRNRGYAISPYLEKEKLTTTDRGDVTVKNDSSIVCSPSLTSLQLVFYFANW